MILEDKMSTRLDIEGQKFNRLIALHDVGSDKKKDRLWECLCDCGKFTVVPAYRLKGGITKSCGCLQKELAGKLAEKGLYRLPIGEANLNRIIYRYKNGAEKRNLKFLLTRKQFKELTQQPCFYCGSKPHTVMSDKGRNGKYIYNGIDRVDNSKGYTINNCVACCRKCNEWKRADTQQEFLMRVKLIYDHMLKGRNA